MLALSVCLRRELMAASVRIHRCLLMRASVLTAQLHVGCSLPLKYSFGSKRYEDGLVEMTVSAKCHFESRLLRLVKQVAEPGKARA